MFCSQVMLECGRKLLCWAQVCTDRVRAGARCCTQCWQQGCSSSPSSGHSCAHQPQVGPLWQNTSQEGHSTGSCVKSSWGSEDENVLQPRENVVEQDLPAGPCGTPCWRMWDFLKELWPQRAHAGVHLTWRTAAPGENHAGAGQRCEKEGAAERSWPDATLPFPSELLKMRQAEVVCVKTCRWAWEGPGKRG